jgi:hypothetical protein
LFRLIHEFGPDQGTVRLSGTDKSGIKCSCNGNISGPLHKSSSVGEQGDRMFSALEAEQHGVVPDGSVGFEAELHGSEIHRPEMLMDLHGVSPAKGYVRTTFPAQVREVSLAADGAA